MVPKFHAVLSKMLIEILVQGGRVVRIVQLRPVNGFPGRDGLNLLDEVEAVVELLIDVC